MSRTEHWISKFTTCFLFHKFLIFNQGVKFWKKVLLAADLKTCTLVKFSRNAIPFLLWFRWVLLLWIYLCELRAIFKRPWLLLTFAKGSSLYLVPVATRHWKTTIPSTRTYAAWVHSYILLADQGTFKVCFFLSGWFSFSALQSVWVGTKIVP
jgi:hypothetical protein